MEGVDHPSQETGRTTGIRGATTGKRAATNTVEYANKKGTDPGKAENTKERIRAEDRARQMRQEVSRMPGGIEEHQAAYNITQIPLSLEQARTQDDPSAWYMDGGSVGTTKTRVQENTLEGIDLPVLNDNEE